MEHHFLGESGDGYSVNLRIVILSLQKEGGPSLGEREGIRAQGLAWGRESLSVLPPHFGNRLSGKTGMRGENQSTVENLPI